MGSEVPASRCIVMWGCNASQSNPNILYPMIVQARKNGAKMIVIDPRRTREADKADLWLQIRPGTDLALMLGWIRLIIAEDLYDHEFVSNWTVGFEELKTDGSVVHAGEGFRDHIGACRSCCRIGQNVRSIPTRCDSFRTGFG